MYCVLVILNFNKLDGNKGIYTYLCSNQRMIHH